MPNAPTSPSNTGPANDLGAPRLAPSVDVTVHSGDAGKVRALAPEDCQKLIHELRVQQIEMEMQNDELPQAMADLADSRAHALELYELAPVGYISLSEAGVILEANRTADSLLGVKPGGGLKQPFQRFIAKHDLDVFYALRNQLSATREPQSCELRLVPAAGAPLWVHVAASAAPAPTSPSGSGKAGALIFRLVLSDINARKVAENELREKEERLALATLHNGIGIWDWNLVTLEMVWDDSMFALYHIRREDFSGSEEAWRASLHPEDLGRGDLEVAEAIAGVRPFDTIFRIVWPNGEIRYIKAVAKVFRDPSGVPLRMLGTNWDITARMQAEAALRETNNRLEAVVSERTAELREANQELHRLLAALAVAEEGERRRIAEGIHEDVLQRLCVVKMALFQPPGMDTSTGFGAGLCNAEKEVSIVMAMLRSLTFDLASPILKNLGLSAGLKTLCTQLEQQHGVPIRFERDEQAGALSPAVEIIVFNAARELLRNAFQHSGAKTLFVALQRRSGCMELIVEDDGIGLDSEQQAKKFSPSGGYGLFNIRKRMQHLQGEMRITPATPRGTRIVLAVPLTADCARID